MQERTAFCDVVGWGVVAVDDIFHIGAFPPADAKVRAERTERRIGGLTGVALLAVANLGGRASYAGVLGRDSLSRFVLETLEAGGVDVSRVVGTDEARPVHAFVVVSAQDSSRTIFYTTAGSRVRGTDDVLREIAARSRVLFFDAFSLCDAEPMLSFARSRGIPVVVDLEPEHVERLRHVAPMIDHLVVPLSAARLLSGCDEADAAARALAKGRVAAVVTAGKSGCWYAAGSAPEKAFHQPVFEVVARNTTGCGDVFHGAYALGVARGWRLEKTVAFAAAAAAVRAEDSAGAGAVTSRQRVRELLGTRV